MVRTDFKNNKRNSNSNSSGDIYIYMHVYVYVYINKYVHIHLHMYVCVYIYMCVYIRNEDNHNETRLLVSIHGKGKYARGASTVGFPRLSKISRPLSSCQFCTRRQVSTDMDHQGSTTI